MEFRTLEIQAARESVDGIWGSLVFLGNDSTNHIILALTEVFQCSDEEFSQSRILIDVF